MKLFRMALALALLVSLSGVAYVSQLAEPTGSKMTSAANQFLGSLKPEQKAKATFDFDHGQRTNWYFVPRQDNQKKTIRKGLPLEEMTPEQKDAAKALLRSALSADGFTKATTIMSLEAILNELEKKGGTMVRNPEWYFFTVFGTPAK